LSSIPQSRLYLDRFLPVVLTSPYIVREMLQLAQVGREDVVYDLGSGDGRILIAAVKEFGAKKAIGYETNEDFYQASLSEIKHQDLQEKITVIKGDLFKADISEASVIALYLSPEAIKLVTPKLEKEANYGTRIVSRGFEINKWQPIKVKNLTYSTGNPSRPIYLYTIPESLK
jgi:predicted RNA methylase